MGALIYYHGNKNYSSWSMRGWLALRLSGLPFEERLFDLSDPEIRPVIRRHSPSGKVPALGDGDVVIWDSLAICEYLAERSPGCGMWPQQVEQRAVARSVAAEMHAGFPDLRNEMPFNVRRSSPGKGDTPGTRRDIGRILEIWEDCRDRFGDGGDFLFGEWSAADVMYAPVVSRFGTYAVAVEGAGRAYMEAVSDHPDVCLWREAAVAEPMIESQFDL